MFELVHDKSGKFCGVARLNGDGSKTYFGQNNREWPEFLKWNDAQPSDKKLDLSDKAPEPPPRDTEREAIETILQKADSDITASEFKTVTLRLARRIFSKGV